MEWLHTLVGLGVGLMVGATGVGAGSLMTPLLLALGIAPIAAVGTSLLSAAVSKSGSLYLHDRRGNIDVRIAGLLAVGSIPASFAGIAVLLSLESIAAHADVLVYAGLALALVLTAASLWLRQGLRATSKAAAWSASKRDWATVGVGAVVGALASLSSVGAGALCLAALNYLYPEKPAVRLVGTGIAHAVPLTLIAGIGLASWHAINLNLLSSLLLGTVPGVLIGGFLAGLRQRRNAAQPAPSIL